MVGIGLLMLAIVALGLLLLWRRTLDSSVWYLRLCQVAAPLGFIAVIAGWTTTEVGRQPWTIYGLMRTAESVSPALTGRDVLASILLYVLVYLIIFPAGLAVMFRLVRRGPARSRASRPRSTVAGLRRRSKHCRQRKGECDARARPCSDLDDSFLASVCSFTSRSTASISASASFTTSRRTVRARNLFMNSIAPIWDGNETWLILGIVGLLAAFPVAFAIIVPAVYFPILLMLLALIFRGVSFEFHYREAERRTFWDFGFGFGSALATFAQGVVLGSFIQGYHVEGRQFVGSTLDCFTPFSIFIGLALMFGYCTAWRWMADPQDRR